MAEKERLTNKERRELARAERKRKEEEARKKARRNRMVSGLVTVLVVGVIVAIVVTAFTGGGGGVSEPILVDFQAAQDAQTAAGCEPQTVQPGAPRDHLDPATAPPPDALYTGVRPAASGSHFTSPGPVATYRNPADERSVVHNLEHGSVVVWYDPDRVSGDEAKAIEDWAEELNASGFDFGSRVASGIITSPFDGTISSGKPIAFRAWERAIDCDTFDPTFAYGMVISSFGTRGTAPEGNFAPFPDTVLGYDPDTLPSDTPTDVGTDAPSGGTEAPTEAAPTDAAPTESTTGAEPGGDPTPTEAAS